VTTIRRELEREERKDQQHSVRKTIKKSLSYVERDGRGRRRGSESKTSAEREERRNLGRVGQSVSRQLIVRDPRIRVAEAKKKKGQTENALGGERETTHFL